MQEPTIGQMNYLKEQDETKKKLFGNKEPDNRYEAAKMIRDIKKSINPRNVNFNKGTWFLTK